MGQLVHMAFDQALEVEHHPGATLRVDRSPGGLRRFGGRDRTVEKRPVAKRYARLNLAVIGIEHIAVSGCFAFMNKGKLVGNFAHGTSL